MKTSRKQPYLIINESKPAFSITGVLLHLNITLTHITTGSFQHLETSTNANLLSCSKMVYAALVFLINYLFDSFHVIFPFPMQKWKLTKILTDGIQTWTQPCFSWPKLGCLFFIVQQGGEDIEKT